MGVCCEAKNRRGSHDDPNAVEIMHTTGTEDYKCEPFDFTAFLVTAKAATSRSLDRSVILNVISIESRRNHGFI